MPKYTRTKKPRKSDRPAKPYDEFPMYAHPLGYWSKKINGKILSFGRWGRVVKGKIEHLPYDKGWQDALAAYKARVDDAHAGRIVETVVKSKEETAESLTVADVCNKFLNAKLNKIKSGELTQRSFQELKATTDRLIAAFGKARRVDDLTAGDFEKLRGDIASNCGPVRLGNEITRIKSVFKYAVDNGLVAGPMRYGSEFKKPDKSVMRRNRAAGGKKLFTAAEIHELLKAATTPVAAMIMLGINAGAGNSDVANLSFGHLDLDKGWLTYARGKTGIGRRIPLWPETVKALRTAIAERVVPKDKKADGDVVLLTSRGERFVRVHEKSRTDGVSGNFGKLLRAKDINGRRGLGFYSLRHTFATIGLELGDRDAVKSLMGHAEGDVLSLYDESGPSDTRLLAVTNQVRTWLFG